MIKTAAHTHTHTAKTHRHEVRNGQTARYLDGLAVVDFHYVEVETVNPFARRDEITSLLVKVLANVHEDLKRRQRWTLSR